MQLLHLLRNKKESEIKRTLIEESEAEHRAVLLTIRILDQITSKRWSSHRDKALRANPSILPAFGDNGQRISSLSHHGHHCIRLN